MTNYYEEIMPIIKDEDDYLKYYFDESTPIFDKLNNIIKKGQPIQRQALLKNLIIYEKESLFKSLMNFIINAIPVWDIETILCFPKSLFIIITNMDYILDQDLFNTIFKHMIKSLSSGFEKARNEYLFYFNKIIEFFSVIDIKNINQIKSNFFPYKINEDIIQLITDLGKFGQTAQNRKLCCYLCSSLCRIYYKGKENNDIQKLYQRLNYLFWDVEKTTEAQMTRELMYIIPLFHEDMFKSEDVIQAVQSYINHDSDHVIQVTVIVALLKNIKYLNKESENCKGVFDILMNKIKEIIEDFDYEPVYKNIILHTLINTLYMNYTELNTSFLYPVFQLGIMKNYYNFYKLDIMFIKNFDKYYFLINYFLENAQSLELKYNENEKSNTSIHKMLVEQINTQINFEAYFIKVINEIFLVEEKTNNKRVQENNTKEKNSNEKEDVNNKEINYKDLLIDNIPLINNNMQSNKEKNGFNVDDLIYDEDFLDENIDIIFNTKKEKENIAKYIYDIDIIKKILYLYLPKILGCFNNIKANKNLCDKLLFLFDKKNIEIILNTYSTSMEYILDNNRTIKNKKNDKNKNILKKHPLYELLLFLLKRNSQIFKYQGKTINKNNSSSNISTEGNIYNKLFNTILTNIISALYNMNNNAKNKSLVLLGKILKLLIPKIYKYYKGMIYNKITNPNDINTSLNLSLNNYKESTKIFYYEKIYEDIFNELISKVINNNQHLGHHILKEYIEIIPILILYSKEKRKYYNFFIKDIFASESFYMRKYALIFYEQSFDVFSMNYLIKNNFFSDFCMLFKDKVNLISINAIELMLKYSKKIISYSKEKFLAACQILNEVYDNNVKALNNKNSAIIFDKEKNIIINKVINISNNINNYYSEEDLNEEKLRENKLLNNEININKNHYGISNKNSNYIENNSNITNNLLSDENTKINIFQSSKLISRTHKFGSMINNNNTQNKNILNVISLSQKPKNGKIFNIDKPLKLFKEKGKNFSNKCNNILKNNFNKENKRNNNELLNGLNFNLNNQHSNKRHNSMSKNIRSFNINKHLLPKLQEQEIKVFEKDPNNKQTYKSVDFTISQYNLLKGKKIKKNENNTSNTNNTNNINKAKERIPSAKIRVIKSYPIMSKDCSVENPNLNFNMKNADEKKNNNINQNLRYSYNYGLSVDDKSMNNKQFSVTIRPRSKMMKLNKNSFISNKIYIDANK